MLNEAEVIKALCDDCFNHQKNHNCDQKGNPSEMEGCYGYLARQIVSLANKSVELPIINDDIKMGFGLDFALKHDVYDIINRVAESQRDADLKALGTTGVWQDKPDRSGWWLSREQYGETYDYRTQFIESQKEVDYFKDFSRPMLRFKFIPEPQEGK